MFEKNRVKIVFKSFSKHPYTHFKNQRKKVLWIWILMLKKIYFLYFDNDTFFIVHYYHHYHCDYHNHFHHIHHQYHLCPIIISVTTIISSLSPPPKSLQLSLIHLTMMTTNITITTNIVTATNITFYTTTAPPPLTTTTNSVTHCHPAITVTTIAPTPQLLPPSSPLPLWSLSYKNTLNLNITWNL